MIGPSAGGRKGGKEGKHEEVRGEPHEACAGTEVKPEASVLVTPTAYSSALPLPLRASEYAHIKEKG